MTCLYTFNKIELLTFLNRFSRLESTYTVLVHNQSIHVKYIMWCPGKDTNTVVAGAHFISINRIFYSIAEELLNS